MPLFEYTCSTCGLDLEIVQRDRGARGTCGQDCVSSGPEWGTGLFVRKLSVAVPLRGRVSVLGDDAPPPPSAGCGHCASDD